MADKRLFMIAATAVALIAAGGWWLLKPNQAGGPQIVADLDNGATVYRDQCQSCHGARLEGQPNWRERLPSGRLPAPPHDASGHTWHHPDEMLLAFIKYGPAKLIGDGYQSDMPGYGEVLSDQDIVDVLAHIKSQWPADIRQRQAEITAQAAKRS